MAKNTQHWLEAKKSDQLKLRLTDRAGVTARRCYHIFIQFAEENDFQQWPLSASGVEQVFPCRLSGPVNQSLSGVWHPIGILTEHQGTECAQCDRVGAPKYWPNIHLATFLTQSYLCQDFKTQMSSTGYKTPFQYDVALWCYKWDWVGWGYRIEHLLSNASNQTKHHTVYLWFLNFKSHLAFSLPPQWKSHWTRLLYQHC